MKKILILGLFTILHSFLYLKISVASTIISHKAYYDLEFLTNETTSSLESGKGKSTFFLKKKCKGWALKETFAISFDLINKKKSKNFSTFTSFEDIESKNFSFEHMDKSDLNENIFYSGFVEKKESRLEGLILDKKNNKFYFEEKILFPTEHLKTLLKNARNQKKFLTTKVFFGSDKDNLVKIVSAFIGKKVNTTFSSKEKWIDKKVWPIQLAFYDINQKLPNPKTIVVAHVDQNGISHYYEVDYGSYRMKGKLNKIEKIKDERC